MDKEKRKEKKATRDAEKVANVYVNGSYRLILDLSGVEQVLLLESDTSQIGETSSNLGCRETFSGF